MKEMKEAKFLIEDAINEAYEQMNEKFELKKGDIVTIKPTGTPRRGPIDDQVWVIIGPQGDGYRYKDSDTGRTSWSPLEFFRDLIIRKRASVKRNNRFVLGTRESHCGTDRKENKVVNEQLRFKFSKDFDKEAKQKGPHQDSSVYKQMRDIVKNKGMGTVKTDKGSMKVDLQSAYRWLASYHALSDKNKGNLIKMAQRSSNSLATTIKVAQTLTVKASVEKVEESAEQVSERLKPGKIDPREAMGKIITGEIKKASLKQAGPGNRRQVYVQVYGKPSTEGAPPDSIYIDLEGFSGAVGIQANMIKSTEIKPDGTLEIRAK
jgi:hypothetical protein